MQNYISEKKDTTRSQELSTEFNFGNSKNVEKIPLNQHKKKKIFFNKSFIPKFEYSNFIFKYNWNNIL